MSKPQSIAHAPCTSNHDFYRFDSSNACSAKVANNGTDFEDAPKQNKRPDVKLTEDKLEPRRGGTSARTRLQQLSAHKSERVKEDVNYGEVKTTDGFSTEAGVLRRTDPKGSRIDVLNVGVATSRQGWECKAQLVSGDTGHGGIVGFDGSILSANAAVKEDKDGVRAGLQGTVIGGAVRIGEANPHDAQDEQVRVGLSYGAGLEGRLHWSDKDKDGHREYGFGVNVGPLSFDLKSETPLFTAAKLLMPGPPNSHELVREAVQRLRSK